MVDVIEKNQSTATDFVQAGQARIQARPDWLRPIAEAALERFNALGLPTTKDEEWRFTNVEPIRKTRFQLVDQPQAKVTRAQADELSLHGYEGARLVFVDGFFSAELSDLHLLKDSVKVVNLSRAIEAGEPAVQDHLAKYADHENEAFTALNTALMEDGAYVHILPSRVVEQPIHLLYIATGAGEPIATHPRNLIVAETNSQATVIEEYVSLSDDVVGFTSAVTEIVVRDNAVLDHYLLERESVKAYNVSTLRVEQGRDSQFASHSVLLGGALVRNNVHAVLGGENCYSLLNGLYVVDGDQHVDNHMRVEHAQPHCGSRQFYKGILDDKARAVFSGRIKAHQIAQKTDAKQSNMNLLLSDDAQADAKPQLEIYADDVKCTHGATIGQLDEEAMFYLRARGISHQAARAILVYAFASESLGRMRLQPVREQLEKMLLPRLSHGELPKELS